MYFDSSIQGYGVGSSGASSCYLRQMQTIKSVLENLTVKKLLVKKYIFSNGVFPRKSSGLDPLNSYLSIPILINSKDHIEAEFLLKVLMVKVLYFY
jgi:mevalonate kinase